MTRQRKKQTLRGKELQQYRQAQYQAWKESGLTQRAYCEAHGLSLYTFNNWREALSKERRVSAAHPSRFIPLALEEETPIVEAVPLHVILPGNVTVVVKEGFNASLLRHVVKALGS